MRQFVKKGVIFLCVFLIVAFLLDKSISHLLKQSTQYPSEYEVMNAIYASEADALVAIYGSSRAWVQFNPQIISDSLYLSVYNYGIDGQNFSLQYLRHLELLKNNPAPKTIIVSVDVFSLQYNEGIYHLEQFLPYMLWNQNIFKFTKPYNTFKIYEYFIPLIRYAGKEEIITTCIQNLGDSTVNPPYRTNGFKGMERIWDENKSYELKDSFEIILDEISIKLFEQFLNETQDLGIKVILVYAPEHRLGQTLVTNRVEIQTIFKKFASQYQIPFWDYSTHPICYNKQLFYNATHLNAEGSELFSKMLASKLKETILE